MMKAIFMNNTMKEEKSVMYNKLKKSDFFEGLIAGIPIGVGYLSVSFTFGIMAVTYGFKWWQAVLISMTTLTSAGQFAGIGIMTASGGYMEMLISQLTINIRYSFMSISLSQKVNSRFKGISRWILGFAMTDEVFAVSNAKGNVSRTYFLGLAVMPYIGWSMGTLCGALLGNILPHRLVSAVGLAIYGMFIAIVVPEMKKSKPVIYAVVIAMILSLMFKYMPYLKDVSGGLAISICAIIAAVVATLIHPMEEENADGV